MIKYNDKNLSLSGWQAWIFIIVIGGVAWTMICDIYKIVLALLGGE